MNILIMIMMIVISLVIAIFGTLFFRKKFGHEHLSKHNEIAGFIYAVIGVIYAVLITYVTVVVWENHQEALSFVDKEAISIVSIQNLSKGIDKNYSHKLNNEINKYLENTINYDWAIMNNTNNNSIEFSKQSEISFQNITDLIYNYTPKNSKDEILIDKLIDKVNELSDNRKLRLFSSKLSVPSLMWFVIIVTGLIVIIFAMLFSSVNLWAQLTMISFLSLSISLVLVLIYAMDHPYSGLLGVEPESLIFILENPNFY